MTRVNLQPVYSTNNVDNFIEQDTDQLLYVCLGPQRINPFKHRI